MKVGNPDDVPTDKPASEVHAEEAPGSHHGDDSSFGTWTYVLIVVAIAACISVFAHKAGAVIDSSKASRTNKGKMYV